MTEAQQKLLIARAKNGDANAFNELVELEYDRIFSFSMAITGGNYDEASDLFQEAIIKGFLNIESFHGSASFSSWLWRIVKNEFINYKKSAKTRDLALLEDSEMPETVAPGDDPESHFLQDERKRHLMELISILPEISQEAIILADIQEMSYEEAAEFANTNVSAFRSRLFKAREQLAHLAIKYKKLFL